MVDEENRKADVSNRDGNEMEHKQTELPEQRRTSQQTKYTTYDDEIDKLEPQNLLR